VRFVSLKRLHERVEKTVTMEENPTQEKRIYEPPQVTAIRLRPEEAVLSFCKNTSSAGQFSSCHHTGGNCHGIGS
jgi:hypothetical protein